MPLELRVKRTRFSLGVCNKAGVYIIICHQALGISKETNFTDNCCRRLLGERKVLKNPSFTCLTTPFQAGQCCPLWSQRPSYSQENQIQVGSDPHIFCIPPWIQVPGSVWSTVPKRSQGLAALTLQTCLSLERFLCHSSLFMDLPTDRAPSQVSNTL